MRLIFRIMLFYQQNYCSFVITFYVFAWRGKPNPDFRRFYRKLYSWLSPPRSWPHEFLVQGNWLALSERRFYRTLPLRPGADFYVVGNPPGKRGSSHHLIVQAVIGFYEILSFGDPSLTPPSKTDNRSLIKPCRSQKLSSHDSSADARPDLYHGDQLADLDPKPILVLKSIAAVVPPKFRKRTIQIMTANAESDRDNIYVVENEYLLEVKYRLKKHRLNLIRPQRVVVLKWQSSHDHPQEEFALSKTLLMNQEEAFAR
jgi:hypothetical protein